MKAVFFLILMELQLLMPHKLKSEAKSGRIVIQAV